MHVFGFTSQYIERNILYEGSKERLYHQILLKFEGIFKYELVICFKKMKERRKDYEQKSKRYIQWKDVLEGKVDSTAFSFLCYKNYSDAMKCSFTGIYFYNEEFTQVRTFLGNQWTGRWWNYFNSFGQRKVHYFLMKSIICLSLT